MDIVFYELPGVFLFMRPVLTKTDPHVLLFYFSMTNLDGLLASGGGTESIHVIFGNDCFWVVKTWVPISLFWFLAILRNLFSAWQCGYGFISWTIEMIRLTLVPTLDLCVYKKSSLLIAYFCLQ